LAENEDNNEIATVNFRYKKPEGTQSIEMEHPIMDKHVPFERASDNLRFASSVAMFGLLFRNSEFKGNSSFGTLIQIAGDAKGKDTYGYRGEFVRLAKTANSLNPIVNG